MKRKAGWGAYPYILPHLVFYVGFLLVPFFGGIYISLQRWSIFKGQEAFVGLKYYLRLFDGDFVRAGYFWKSLWVTAQFVIYCVPALIAISLALALLLHACKNKWIRVVGQFSFLVPTAIAVSVIAVIWRWILGYEVGIANFFVTHLGLGKLPWLTDVPWAWVSIIVPTLWMACGWNMVLFLVGLQTIPESLYEAAEVDGASPWQRFLNITLPGLKPITLFVVITQIIAAFNLFAQPQLLTLGGPGRETTPVMMFLFQEAFEPRYPRLGSSMAMGFVTGAIVFSIVYAVHFLFSRQKD